MSKQYKVLLDRRSPRGIDLRFYLYNTPVEYIASLSHAQLRKIGKRKHDGR